LIKQDPPALLLPPNESMNFPRRFFSWLFRTDRHPLACVFMMWPTATLPGLLIVIAAGHLLSFTGNQELFEDRRMEQFFDLTAWTCLAVVVIAPLIETVLMNVICRGLKAFFSSMVVVTCLSAVFWAGVHSLANSPIWGVGVFWPFIIFSGVLLAWWEKSPRLAFWMTFAIHALHNLTTLGLVALSSYWWP